MNSKEVEIVFRMKHKRGLKKRRNGSQVLALRLGSSLIVLTIKCVIRDVVKIS